MGFIQPNVNETFAWLEKVRRDSAMDILILGDCGRVDFLFPKKIRQKILPSLRKKQTTDT